MFDLIMGIDVGNSQSVIHAFSEVGEVVLDAQRIETFAESAWRDLLEDLSAQYSIRACFEVGPHYEWLYDLLLEYCREVEVVNPADFVLISRSQRKTDKIDAQKLAEGLYRGDLPTVYVPDKEVRADRRLVSFVHKLSQDLSTVKGRIRSLLIPQRLVCPYGDVLGRRGRKWLEAEAMPRLCYQERRFLEMLMDQADQLLSQRAELDRSVEERAGAYECAGYLRSVPGFGPLTTLALASATGDVSRFSTPGQLASYFGVCGSIHQSGRSVWRGGLTKRGKPTGVARGAQMRWLTEIVWRLMTYGEYYRIKPLSRAEA